MAATTWVSVIKIIAIILSPLLAVVSPMIKKFLGEQLQDLHRKALATDNPVDDLFTGLLLDLLSIPRPE